jgi:phage-related protein
MSKESSLAVDAQAFGDGYTHRATRGLNPVRPAWTLSFPVVGEAELAAMDSFLAANAARGFWFQPPGEAAPVFVVADSWSAQVSEKSRKHGYLGALQASFVRAFNPQPLSAL